MIEQFVPQEFCLHKCGGCCRFSEAESIWSPCLLKTEISSLLKQGILPAVISENKKLRLVSYPAQDNFVCPFLNPQDQLCKIYTLRPLECQIYPFLINQREGKIYLSVDLGCPYIKANLERQEFKDYTAYLADFLKAPAQTKMLQDNPQLLQAYADAWDLAEFSLFNEVKPVNS